MSQIRDSGRRDRRSSRKLKRKGKKRQSKADEFDVTEYSDEEEIVENQDDEQRNLLEVLGNLFNNEKLSDVHFVVGPKKKRIPAHRVLLSARSEVFDRMLNGNMKESNIELDIDIPDMDSSAFLPMLKFVYTGKSDLTPETAMGTLYAAKKYGVHGLRQSCVKYLKSSLTVRNGCMILEQAQLFDEKSLEKRCLRLIERNTKDVLLSVSFKEISKNGLASILLSDHLRIREIVIFRGCLRWAENECKRQRIEVSVENKRLVLKEIIPHIRFPLLSATDLIEVAESSILESDEMKFLVIGTDWANEVAQLISSNVPALVDAVNPNVDQLTLSGVEFYHSVIVYSSSGFNDPEDLGDVLADYIDGGGGVVIAAIAIDIDNHGVSGRFIRDEYLPLNRGERSNDSRHVIGKRNIPDHPILKDVHSFDGGPQSWRVKATTANNSRLIAEWEDGIPFVAEKTVRDRNCSVALNIWPPSRFISKDGWETFTDGVKLLSNSLMYTANTY